MSDVSILKRLYITPIEETRDDIIIEFNGQELAMWENCICSDVILLTTTEAKQLRDFLNTLEL